MREIELSSRIYNLSATVDDCDYIYLKQFKWFAKNVGRSFIAYRWTPQRHHPMHREIMGFPENREIDHIDHNGLNNQRSNLRIVEHNQNCRNLQKRLGTMYSKYKGVTYFKNTKRKKRWFARIRIDYKEISLGYFATELEAAQAYDEASLKYHGEYGLRNFAEEVG